MSTSDERAASWYPEHQKLKLVHRDSHKIGEFLEWLSENKFFVCEQAQGLPSPWGRDYVLTSKNTQQILAAYFKIDQKKIDEEKDLMLWQIQTTNDIAELTREQARVRDKELREAWARIESEEAAAVDEDSYEARRRARHAIEVLRESALLRDRFPDLGDT